MKIKKILKLKYLEKGRKLDRKNIISRILLDNYNVKYVNKEKPEILIVTNSSILTKKYKKKEYENSKILLATPENIRDFKINILYIIFKFIKKDNIKKFQFFFDFLLSIKVLYLISFKPFKSFLKEAEKNKNYIAIIPCNLKNDRFFSLPFFHYLKDRLFKNKKKQKINKKFCCFFVSNPINIERNIFFKKLSKYKKIDSYGKVYNNSNIKNEKIYKKNYQIFKEYKFVICFENSFSSEYVTEKLPNAMLGNSIPIYRGAPDVSKYFNTKSFINFENYGKSYDKMIEKIIELDNDDKKYKDFLKEPWMTKENKKIIENKEKDLENFLKKNLDKNL